MTAALETDLWLLGVDAPGELDERARRAIGLAAGLGAPVRDVLAQHRARGEAAADARRALRQATAQGRAAALGLLVAPPLVAPLLARVAGVDARPRPAVLAVAVTLWVAGALLTVLLVRRATGPGRRPRRATPVVVLVVGVGVLVVVGPLPAAVVVVLGLARALQPRREPPPAGLEELLELTALALRTGRGIAPALRAAGGQVPALLDVAQRLALWLELGGVGTPPALPELATALARTRHSGAPALTVVHEHAVQLRRAELHDRLERAERLPVQLTVPMTLLLLPAALLLALAPLVELVLAGLA